MNTSLVQDVLELEDQLHFERLITDLSSRFINLRPEAVDLEIESAMQQVCEGLGLDRCTLAQYDEPARRFISPIDGLLPGSHPYLISFRMKQSHGSPKPYSTVTLCSTPR